MVLTANPGQVARGLAQQEVGPDVPEAVCVCGGGGTGTTALRKLRKAPSRASNGPLHVEIQFLKSAQLKVC